MKQKYHMHNRPDRALHDKKEIDAILKTGKFATLAFAKESEPYIVTLSYGYDIEGQSLYFHCAKEGLKLEFMKSNPNVCATIINDLGYIKNECGHAYRSVLMWGKMFIVDSPEEQKYGMEVLLKQLEDDSEIIKEKRSKSVHSFKNMLVLKLNIEYLTAKAGR